MKRRKRVAELLELGRPDDRPSRIVNVFLIALISLNVIAVFLESEAAIYQRFESALYFFNVFSVAVFTVEYLARIWSAVDLGERAYSSPFIGRIRYMLSPLALVDLLAILPFYLSLYLSMDLRFLRGLRLLRLLKLTRYSPALSALLEVIRQESQALLSAFVVLVIMLVMSAGGIYVLENELQPEAFGSMISSMWWAIITLTTVGYGDTVPVTVMGKMFAGLIGLIGIGMIALPAAILASGFAENIRNRKQEYNLQIQHFMADGELDDTEREQLEKLRKELGLDSEEAMQVLQEVLLKARQIGLTNCPHCGKYLR